MSEGVNATRDMMWKIAAAAVWWLFLFPCVKALDLWDWLRYQPKRPPRSG